MTDPPLAMGILSTGNIARQFAEHLQEAEHASAVAVGSRSADSASGFAARHGIDPGLAVGGTPQDPDAGYRALLDCPEVEAVYIALPNSLHHRWTLAALEAGKHVLCEKPMAANADEAREMFDAADRHDRLLVEAFMYRSTPLMHAVARTIREGQIGTVRLVRSSFCYAMHQWQGNVRFNAELAGGALMDIGCYCLNFSRFIARLANGERDCEPAWAHAVAHLHETSVDDYTVGVLGFHLTHGESAGQRVLADFACGMSLQSNNTAIVSGSQGYIEIPIPWKPPRDGARYAVDFQTPPKLAGGGAKPGKQAFSLDLGKPVFALEADDFARAVRGEIPPAIAPADTIGNMALLDTLRRQVGVAV